MSVVIVGNINSMKTALSYRNKEILDPSPEPFIGIFHYRATVLTLFCSCLLVTSTMWIAGEVLSFNIVHNLY